MEFTLIQKLVKLVHHYDIMFSKKRAPNYITFWGGSLGLFFVGLIYGFLSHLAQHNFPKLKWACVYIMMRVCCYIVNILFLHVCVFWTTFPSCAISKIY